MIYQETCIILCIPRGEVQTLRGGIEEGFLFETELCRRLEPASLGSVW